MAAPAGHLAASRLAQLLADTIVQHTPWSADIDARTRRAVTDEWLEGLESHTAPLLKPFLTRLIETSDPPPAVRTLLTEAIAPSAQFGVVVQQIFLYGIVSNLIGTTIEPFMQEIVNSASSAAVAEGIARPVDPATIATAVARGLELGAAPTVTVPEWAHSQAAQSGVNADNLNLMASIVGLPPALQELFELFRRGVITIDQVKLGLREGDFRDDWVDIVVALAHSWLSPLDFVRAAVQSQMSYAEAREWATRTGLDSSTPLPVDTGDTEATPDMFGLAFAIAGRPPGPVQLGDMALRGIIPWEGTGAGATTFQQGIAESDVKTKWTGALRKLTAYLPPPSAIGTLLERGAIDKQTAVGFWEARGVPAALAEGYAFVAEQQHVGQDKLLAKGEVTQGFFDGIFDRARALELLGDLGYRGDVAGEILDVTLFRRRIAEINRMVARVGTEYVAFRLDAADAKHALIELGVGADQAQALLATWEAVRVEPLRVPTPREIARAVRYGTLTASEALAELAKLGYQPRDAAIVLSSESTKPVTPLPPAGSTITG